MTQLAIGDGAIRRRRARRSQAARPASPGGSWPCSWRSASRRGRGTGAQRSPGRAQHLLRDFDADEVVIFKGRPGGFFWFDPTLEEAAGHLTAARCGPAGSPPSKKGSSTGRSKRPASWSRRSTGRPPKPVGSPMTPARPAPPQRIRHHGAAHHAPRSHPPPALGPRPTTRRRDGDGRAPAKAAQRRRAPRRNTEAGMLPWRSWSWRPPTCWPASVGPRPCRPTSARSSV